MRTLLLENIHPRATALLADAGWEVEALPRRLEGEVLREALRGVSVLGIRSGTRITEELLTAAESLLVVGVFSIGTSQVDLAAASRHGVAVFNAPFSSTRSVVELAIAEMIALARRLPETNANMHSGIWDKSSDGVHEIGGRTLGIVGYGNIGSRLSTLAEALGMTVCFYDVVPREPVGNARQCATLDELLESADVVSIHVDGRAENQELLGEAQLSSMRPGSLLLNLSRGFVVDQKALRRHIESGHIAGAAFDVFATEPKLRGDPFLSELRGLPNVILTPHIGGSTEEAQRNIAEFVVARLLDYTRTGGTELSVNFPQIALPWTDGTHRLAHLHADVPGVLAAVNQALAQRGVSIRGQALATRNGLGYVLTDTDAVTEGAEPLLSELRGMRATIRLRTPGRDGES
ncbi:MAG TPA: phosphoglycerate dehydrogenase [Streptosporangiaceae bacterium]|nr:phosphoglycerate dehydrogenase [Streptosporangiaceae bacterium]